MSLSIRVKIPPGYARSNEIIRQALQVGIQRATGYVTTQAIIKAPRKKGTLKRSIHSQIDPGLGKFTGRIVQDTGVAKYGPLVEFGTGVHHEPSPNQPWTITPVNKKALYWKGANHPVKRVTVKGMKAQSYMRSTMKESVKQIESILNDRVQKAIKEIMGG